MAPRPTLPALTFPDLQARILDMVDTAIIVIDLDGHIIFANRFASTLYGWGHDDLVGTAAGDLMDKAIARETQTEIAQAILRGGSWQGTFDVRRKDGWVITVRAVDTPLLDDDGNIVGIISAGMDASRERAAEQQLLERTRAAQVSQFLADCGTAIASSSDYEEALVELGRSCVPFLADLCMVDLAEADHVRRVVAAHHLPDHQELVEGLSEQSPDPGGAHPAVSALRSGQVAFSPEMSDEFLRSTTRSDEHFAIVKALNFQSYICVPLVARGRILGALTLVSCNAARRFTEDDLHIAQEVAWRASLMLDNARLFSESSHIAQVLQASLMPPSLPAIPGIELAARYVAFGAGIEVGGDFYDVFSAGYGAWVFVLGDVCGRGPEAAVVTGLIRHTLRSAVHEVRQPGRLLGVVNDVLLRDADDDQLFSTLLCGVLRSHAGSMRLSLANAGHPPPIVIRADGNIETPTGDDTIVGVFENLRWRSRPLVLQEGDLLLAYTDGITEARREGEFFGEERLAAVAHAARHLPLESIADRVIDAVRQFAGNEPSDDLALVALRVVPS
ncbi:MAG TPA: SpoIIE family protein phosphatase [Acidimicrobiales bacterium]|jgi:PAS domain S-box-containing protein|nr:SpoIIE family protein phosphatase [Acidimicrobiales bacterium]